MTWMSCSGVCTGCTYDDVENLTTSRSAACTVAMVPGFNDMLEIDTNTLLLYD